METSVSQLQALLRDFARSLSSMMSTFVFFHRCSAGLHFRIDFIRESILVAFGGMAPQECSVNPERLINYEAYLDCGTHLRH